MASDEERAAPSAAASSAAPASVVTEFDHPVLAYLHVLEKLDEMSSERRQGAEVCVI